MKTLLAVANMQGSVVATDSCKSLYSLGNEFPIIISLVNNTSNGCQWSFFFDDFKKYLEKAKTETSFSEYSRLFSEFVSGYTKECFTDSDIHQEVLFLGYGDDDIFPSYSRCEFVLSSKHPSTCSIVENCKIDLSNKVILKTFGDCEDIDAIISGISSSLKKQIVDEFGKSAKRVKEMMLEAVAKAGGKPKDIKIIKEIDLNSIEEGFVDKLNMYEENIFDDKLHFSIDGFNIEDMIKMSEDIINLAGMRRHFREDQTIMDSTKQIAIVTRAEGFVWIKNVSEEAI